MTTKYKVFPAPLKIRYKGYFDFEGVYRLVNNWLVKYLFRYHEQRYKDKTDTPLGNEIEVDVWGEKEVTEYYKYKIIISYHLWESREVPVVINGEKVKRMRGRMHITLQGEVITDWQGRYKGSKVRSLMEEFLNKTVLKKEREMKHVDYVDKQLHKLEGEIKKFLKMETKASGVG